MPLVLISPWDDALFVWRKSIRDDGQSGVCCAVFRNESAARSSEMILEAEQLAWAKWPRERLFTHVDPAELPGTNPGYCFKAAGWKLLRHSDGSPVKTTRGLLILEKLPMTQEQTEISLASPALREAARPMLRAEVWNEDCIAGMAAMLLAQSVHLIVTSIPFEELFTYSGKLEDVGNNGSTIDIRRGRFALNLRFVVDQLFRVLADGCPCCVHIQQLLAYKNQHGFSGRRDFRGAVVDVFRAGGFEFWGEIVIPKDPQAMAQRLNLHSLQFKTGISRSATRLAPAVNDYVLIFGKPGEPAVPVRSLYHEVRNPLGQVTTDEWVKWARGVWDDIDEFDILDGARSARESDEEKHVCPLQLEIIRRLIRLYTNPADLQPDVTVLDPFMGIGSVAHEAVILGRNAVGFELKESYHANAVKNIERARVRAKAAADRGEVPGLFGNTN